MGGEAMAEAKRRRGVRPELILLLIALVCLCLFAAMAILCIPYYGSGEAALSVPPTQEIQPTQEPEEEPEETVEVTIPPELSPYNKWDFQYNHRNFILCTRQVSYPGIDVSFYQHDIDWKKVKDSGIQFAMIRLGIRGWGMAGRLVEDEYAKQNLKGAQEAGLAIGAYFFSQATTIDEVDDEISFLMSILGDMPLDMPLVLDWERITEDGSRSKDMDRRTLTDLLLHYCREVEAMGYQPMIYFNPNQAKTLLYLNELEDYPFWLAFYTDRMTYPFRVEMWQYTESGRIPGIEGNVDINVYMPDHRVKY